MTDEYVCYPYPSAAGTPQILLVRMRPGYMYRDEKKSLQNIVKQDQGSQSQAEKLSSKKLLATTDKDSFSALYLLFGVAACKAQSAD